MVTLVEHLVSKILKSGDRTSAQLNETFHVGDYCACTINDKDWDRGVIHQLGSNSFATIFRINYDDVQFLWPLE
ncbi:unnamed protein product, partial [Rotaria magnacalcarata]